MMLQQQHQKSSQAQNSTRLKQVELALEGLRNVIKNNPGMNILNVFLCIS